MLKEIVQARKAYIEAIHRSKDSSFNALFELSGLDRRVDFRSADLSGMDMRGADLRGFDLSGSDLRGCLRDAATLIDETTMDSAEVAWIDPVPEQIVARMLSVQSATGSNERRRYLERLVKDYQSPEHIRLPSYRTWEGANCRQVL